MKHRKELKLLSEKFKDPTVGGMSFYEMDKDLNPHFLEIAQRLNKIADIPVAEDATTQMVPLRVAIAIINDVARKYDESLHRGYAHVDIKQEEL